MTTDGRTGLARHAEAVAELRAGRHAIGPEVVVALLDLLGG